MAEEPVAHDMRAVSGEMPRKTASTPAFASYIDSYQVANADTLNPQLERDIIAWRDESAEGIKSSNNIGWHSSRDLYERKEESFRELTAQIAAATTASIRRYWAEFDPRKVGTAWEGWANINGPAAVNGPHSHTYHLSGVYYVKVPKAKPLSRDGMIEFLNPAGALSRASMFEHRLIHSSMRLLPKAGQLIIFPAYLKHWVYPHYEEGERISIAFNVAVMDQRAAR